MNLDNNIKTSVNLRSEYSDSSINDSSSDLQNGSFYSKEKLSSFYELWGSQGFFQTEASARSSSDKKKLFAGTLPENVLIWIDRFSTKKNIGSKDWKWSKMHFKTNLFFSIFGGVGGHFTITDHLKLLTSLVRPSGNCSPTRIIQNLFHDM